jgi:carbamoyltransferase
MNILGISAGYHDAAATIINRSGDILFAGHSERYSKIKNDANISAGLIEEISKFNLSEIAYYERPWAKQLRRLYSGEGIQWGALTLEQCLQRELGGYLKIAREQNITDPLHPATNLRTRSFNHHLSHAAGGFQTSPYDRATVVVIDAIGEWDTISIWGAEYDKRGRAQYKRLWTQRYPHSLGLFYSAITKRVGLHPLDEEYITMGMAAYGDDHYHDLMEAVLISDAGSIEFKQNLHTGVSDNFMGGLDHVDIAAAAQRLLERLIGNVMRKARDFKWSTNLVYQGGVALNCLANRKLNRFFDDIWIMPNPGDAGSSLGAAALAHGGRINWTTAFLGYDIPGGYPVNDALEHLVNTHIVGVASGRAEFGPRALGNRSLLADPRGKEIKDKVNAIKRRQKFRPFAPVILAELADDYFDIKPGWHTHSYMQSVATCREPDLYPAICHVDGTSRVQTVANDGSGIRQLLETWYAQTGCPMLLNTSLNIRGEPIVNNRTDADRFENMYGVKVIS